MDKSNFYKIFLFVFSLALSGSVLAQGQTQTGAQANTSVQSQTSVSADKSGAKASNSTEGAAQAGASQAAASLTGGSEINAALSRPVDANKNKPGDEVIATTTQDVKSAGKVTIPKGSKLIGHVTQAQPRGAKGSSAANADAASKLGIVFDRAVLKNGSEVPIGATIQAVAAAGSNVSSSGVSGMDTDIAGAGNATGSGRAAGGGLVGGVTGTAGGAVGAVGGAGGAVNSTLSGTVGAAANITRSSGAVGGLNAAGQLTSGSKGVFGLKGLEIAPAATGNVQGQGSVITSATKNVRLDSGTNLLLVTGASAMPR